jgi:hypothetical protein
VPEWQGKNKRNKRNEMNGRLPIQRENNNNKI